MSTKEFRDAVANAKPRPKGVKVSSNLYRELEAEDAISIEPFTLWGLQTETFRFDLPAYERDIYVHVEPSFNDHEFQLPPSSN